MLATAAAPSSPPMATLLEIDQEQSPLGPAAASHRQFKRHKVLPRPPGSRGHVEAPRAPRPSRPDLALDTSVSTTSSQSSSPRTLKNRPKKLTNGPDMPPTPPTHSRTSSSSHTALPSSPTIPDHALRTPKKASTHPPTTPPDQRSPPTPDVTPPQPISRPKALRPGFASRGASGATATDSRTDSFRTAREEPLSSEEDDGKSTVRPAVASGRTSQTTVRKTSDTTSSRVPHPQALDMALARLTSPEEDSYTPRTLGELARFDGDWGSSSEVENEWDDNLHRTVTVKKRRPTQPKQKMTQARRGDVVGDADDAVLETISTKAMRDMSLHDKASSKSPARSHTDRGTQSSSGPTYSDSSVATSQKRSSGVSSRSLSSTVVEAFLFDTPQKPPQRQRTLRHVRKQSALRNISEPLPDRPSLPVERGRRPMRPPLSNSRPDHGSQHSHASTTTVNSISSSRARREVWKSGGIPVVVVPDRRSSKSRSREPSLRSTSSRQSRRTQSLSSAPLDVPMGKDAGLVFERPCRRSRAFSLSGSSDTRTIDFPPAIPPRSSSLSAPTSRNTSRAGSMTVDSLSARDAIGRPQSDREARSRDSSTAVDAQDRGTEAHHHSPLSGHRHPAPVAKDGPHLALPPRQLSPPKTSPEDDGRAEAPLSPRKISSRNTPFSVASMETNATAPEVSEAQAVHMYPHQNSSLLMVNHSGRPSDVSSAPRSEQDLGQPEDPPMITTTGPENDVPVTPPRPQFSLDDVDSPLRNPRAPPEPPSEPQTESWMEQQAEPPAITFTSATPSGATPAPDKAIQMGNYFETMAELPARRPSLVKRAFSRHRRNPVPYPPNSSRSQRFLSRTFSLPRRRDYERNRGLTPSGDYPSEDCTPPEEDKLHPFWRPQWSGDGSEDDYNDDDHDGAVDDEQSEVDEGEHLRYPPVDNRPSRPRRRFSDKMKRTFAIFPHHHDEEGHYIVDGYGPERRTIRRTPSGNLRVMRRRNSASSLRRRFSQSERPYTAPDGGRHRSIWRGRSVHGRPDSQSHRRFSLGDQLGEIQGIPRRLSDRRREKRTQELRQKISGPREVRDGVEEMIRSGGRDRLPPA